MQLGEIEMQLGEKVRVYTDYWGVKGAYCLPCAHFLDEENGGLSIVYPAYAECTCEQCDEPQIERSEDE